MNIIFGEPATELRERYVILELDTFVLPDQQRRTAWCVVENVTLGDFPILNAYQQAHSDMMQAYRDQNWQYCRSALEGLVGRWNGELDSFYQDLAQRVKQYETEPPSDHWDGARSWNSPASHA